MATSSVSNQNKKSPIREKASFNNKRIFEGLDDIGDDSSEIKLILQAIRSQQTIHIKHAGILGNENIRLQEIDTSSDSFLNLKESIKTQGLIQNLVVEFRQKDHEKYDLVCVSGHRRLKALKELQFEGLVPVKIVHGSSKHLSLSENVLRQNLHFVEVANCYNTLLTEEGFNLEKISKLYEKDKSTISYYIKIGQWPEDIKEKILSNPEILSFNYVWKNLVKRKKTDSELRKIIAAKLSCKPNLVTGEKKIDAKSVRQKKLTKFCSTRNLSEDQVSLINDAMKYLRLI